jgi:leucyl-tRNA synthetase
VHRLFTQKNKIVDDPKILTNNLDRAYHVFLKEVNVAIENHAFNVAISKMMVYINACYHASKLFKPHIMGFTIVLSCFAPHLAEEL